MVAASVAKISRSRGRSTRNKLHGWVGNCEKPDCSPMSLCGYDEKSLQGAKFGRRGSQTYQSIEQRNLAVFVAARAQSGGLVCLGGGGVPRGAEAEQADFFVGGIFHLLLVSRDGAAEF